MKKITFKTILMCVIYILLICNICYADVIYAPTVMESAVSVIAGEGEFFELVIFFVPLIIIYIILVEILLLRNKKKTKAKKIIVVILTLILLIFNIIALINTIKNNTIEKVKYGYVDQNDNYIIEPREFDYAEEFSNGVAKIGHKGAVGDFHHSSGFPITRYGYMNKNRDIIIPTEYYELSYFNEDGYAYGFTFENYRNIIAIAFVQGEFKNISKDYIDKLDIHFYKLDREGNKEEIPYEQYAKEVETIPENTEFDKDIKLKKQVDKEYTDDMIYVIMPIINIIIAIIVLIKVFKKSKKEDVEIDEKNEG